jgi:uncharacterized membrane protein
VGKGRLEAFSDGVLAIIITIMVLELRVPPGARLQDLQPVLPTLLSYGLSFVYVGIYWTNHHHLLHAAKTVRGPILWANLHLLFWLSLTPFTTAWMGQHPLAAGPVALYGANQFLDAVAYSILQRSLVQHEGPDSPLARALSHNLKGLSSLAIYAAAIPMAFFQPLVSIGCFILVAAVWLVPDLRIERALDVR